MEIQGKIDAILPAVGGVSQRTGNPWKKQTFILQTEEQYPKKIPFDIFGEDKIVQMNVQPGESVTVFFDIEGHEYNGRWFTSLRCFNVIKTGQQMTQATRPQPQPQPQPVQQQAPRPNPNPYYQQDQGYSNDLPF